MIFVKIIAFMIVLSTVSHAAIREIVDGEIFGCYATSDSVIEFENYVVEKVLFELENNPHFSWIKKGEFSKPVISPRYLFEEVPHLHMYYVFTWIIGSGGGDQPYEGVLFNLLDSTIYYFDGDASKFSDVMQEYIKEIQNCEQAISLVDLYFITFTTSGSDPMYLINSIKGLESIWRMYGFRAAEKKLEQNILKVKKIFTPIRCSSEDNVHEVECFVVDIRSSILYKYKFQISERGFSIINRELIFKDIGPYRGWHR